ncbi:DNA/RNA non-specific endonuclease [Micromonospora sp. DT81.3]|uniref:DNA/RNA non-specific endonuclease n=1 Tax=Actinomycetes TaxID=1760 RepID=UPI003CEF115F
MIDAEEVGYDASFLGVPVPVPTPLGGAEVRELAYLHFSVLLDIERRLASVTAVNIDGEALLDLPRTGRWELDARVPASAQAGPALYSDNDFDRGHMVRRRDPGWGDAATARAATEQTFVYTNAAPQVGRFNQGEDLWVGLEDHVLGYADAQDLRVSVFTAPVLVEDDPLYRGVQIPRRFWKVAAWASDGALSAAGFVLDQSALLRDGSPRAVPPLGGFRTFQAPIAELGDLAGIDFGPLVAADVLVPVTALPRPRWRELRTTADIVL